MNYLFGGQGSPRGDSASCNPDAKAQFVSRLMMDDAVAATRREMQDRCRGLEERLDEVASQMAAQRVDFQRQLRALCRNEQGRPVDVSEDDGERLRSQRQASEEAPEGDDRAGLGGAAQGHSAHRGDTARVRCDVVHDTDAPEQGALENGEPVLLHSDRRAPRARRDPEEEVDRQSAPGTPRRLQADSPHFAVAPEPRRVLAVSRATPPRRPGQHRLLRRAGPDNDSQASHGGAEQADRHAGVTSLTTSTGTPGLAEDVTPAMLDCGDMYKLNESVWDIMIMMGHDSIGRLNSFIIVGLWLLNLLGQALFIGLIVTLLMERSISATKMDGLLKFRLGLAHRAEYADKVTERSMAEQLCSQEKKLHLSGQQADMFADMEDFVVAGGASKTLMFFIQYLWLCTVMKDLANTKEILSSVWKIKEGRTTRLVVADLRDEGEQEATHQVLARGNTSSSQISEPEETLAGFMKIVRIRSMNMMRKVFVLVAVCIPKLTLSVGLYMVGAVWLANTTNFSELILNGVALAFVLEFDEALYSVFLPRRSKTLITNLEPLPYRRRNPGTALSGLNAFFMVFLIVSVMVTVYFVLLHKTFWQLHTSHRVLCSGNYNFIYATNPATQMIHVAATKGEDVYTDTEEVIAQVAQVAISEHDYWKDFVPQAIFDACSSDFERAVVEDGTNAFDSIVQMSGWSIADAAAALPCQDLASGQSQEASVKTLQVLLAEAGFESNISSCLDIPLDYCAYQDMTWLRAICPRHCRCEETLLSNTGFFQLSDFGCPSQCETFKAAKNEIDFRFQLTKLDTARRLSNTTYLSPIFEGCTDLEPTDLSFGGGCSDSNGETHVDKNDNDCTVYGAAPELCGSADDDDFTAAHYCCDCGGGYQNVKTSVECYDSFTEACWLMPPNAIRFVLYVRGLFEYSLSSQGFTEGVTNVVEMDYAGIAPDENTAAEIIDHIVTGEMARSLASGSWDLVPGLVPHPRNLTGCDFLASYEVTSLLNIDLCAEGVHTPIRFLCPVACGCDESRGLDECPAACVLAECYDDGTANESCAHVHPWYSEECIAGYHNDGGDTTCYKCTGGETRRRRATDCTECGDGYYDLGNLDDCVQCQDGQTRRRRSTSCTDCDPGTYDTGDADECTLCVGGTTRRRRATSCTDCPYGTYKSQDMTSDECEATLGCSTTRRRAAVCIDCGPGWYNNGSSDDCVQCVGGSTDRVECTPCEAGKFDDGDYDDCKSVDCPAHSTEATLDGGVAAGCACDAGYVGTVRATTQDPYFSGECLKIPFHTIGCADTDDGATNLYGGDCANWGGYSWYCGYWWYDDNDFTANDMCCSCGGGLAGTEAQGYCQWPITTDQDLCSSAMQELGVTAEITVSTEVLGVYGCSVDKGKSDITLNSASAYYCGFGGSLCVCLGTGNESTCADSGANTDCPQSSSDDFEEQWGQYCDLPSADSCCDCKGGGAYTSQLYELCADTNNGASSDLQEGTDLNGCLKWDWYPSNCQLAPYYDDTDFSPAEMCCACGGGYRWTTTASSTTSVTSTSTYHTTTATATSTATITATATSTFTATACQDLVPDGEAEWYDADGPSYNCAWYADGTNCDDSGDSHENFGMTANEACCVCGGG